MKKLFICIHIVYIFLIVCGSVFAVGERTISIGGRAGWSHVETRSGITEASAVRPNTVLLLSSTNAATGYTYASGVSSNTTPISNSALDMSVSFDERQPRTFSDSIGNYRLIVPNEVENVDRALARAGAGAALFGRPSSGVNRAPIIIQPQNRNALFSNENRIRDFTIEFWLYPQNMENGEQVFSWTATRPINRNHVPQQITCVASRNRFTWTFNNFFTSINGTGHLNIEFSGSTPIVPRRWSHHLIRFDAATGLIEYLVDGNSEAIAYATQTGRENSEVYTPIIGNNGSFLLGERFNGMLDEFRLYGVYAGRTSNFRYIPTGGIMETRPLDLGLNSSGLIKINVTGGRTSIQRNSVRNEFRENGRFRFNDDTEMHFFVRASDNPYLLNRSRWVSFTPGADISGVQGRYVQIKVDFYPSADGESSPYLEEMQIVFMPGLPPLPPRNVVAVAEDGRVILRWRHSPAANINAAANAAFNNVGYKVYYSSVRGELFGTDSSLGASPINVGSNNQVVIDGLRNGTLYYFRVSAYDLTTGNESEFSVEVTARPLEGLSQ